MTSTNYQHYLTNLSHDEAWREHDRLARLGNKVGVPHYHEGSWRVGWMTSEEYNEQREEQEDD